MLQIDTRLRPVGAKHCLWRRLAMALPLTACIACSKGDGRVDISGKVTWKGQPVPAGMILFNPDVKAGNIGPQGMAPIKDGRYDTRGTGGRPVTPGAHLASVHGFDGRSQGEERPRGKRIFMPAEVTVTAPERSGTLDLVVPDDAQAL